MAFLKGFFKDKQNNRIFVLLVMLVSIQFIKASSERVEFDYSQGVYAFLAKSMQYLTGWIPFSLGDFLYMLYFGYLLLILGRYIKNAIKQQKLTTPKFSVKKGIAFCLFVYVWFYAFWGINYNRMGITYQLGLNLEQPYGKQSLTDLLCELADSVNQTKMAIHGPPLSFNQIQNEMPVALNNATKVFRFLPSYHLSLKKSLFSTAGNYLAFSGYYSPFTGEAQVNTDLPAFTHPFIASHEVAHQLAYAKENEANLVGYLIATASDDPHFRYAAFFDLYVYTLRNVYRADSVAAATMHQSLHSDVQKDLEALQDHYRAYRNPFEPVTKWMYGKFLQMNQQPSGMVTYSKVVGDLMAFRQKYGTISTHALKY